MNVYIIEKPEAGRADELNCCCSYCASVSRSSLGIKKMNIYIERRKR